MQLCNSTSPRKGLAVGRRPVPIPLEEEEEEEGLYLRIETRKRVQTNEAKSKRRRASPTKNHRSTGQHPGLPMPAFPPSAAG